jgi:hypothetical protein
VGCGCSPRAWSGLDGRAEVSATLTGGRDGAALAGRVDAEVPRALGHRGSTRGVPVMVQPGQEGLEITGGDEFRRRTDSPVVASGSIPAATRVGVTVAGLEKFPGGEAELLRGLAGARGQREGRSTVEQEA